MVQRTCTYGECDSPHEALGYCRTHYNNLRRWSDPAGRPIPGMPQGLPGECWLPAPSYEGFYEVSDLGRVRSLPRLAGGSIRGGRIRKLYIGPDGYPRVTLSALGVKSGPLLVHRLVMAAFIGPCPEGEEVRHMDGKRANGVLSNLAYGTHGENMQDMLDHGTNHWMNKTHCPHGHEYTPENTYIDSRGSRVCRQCWRVPVHGPHYNSIKTHCPKGHEYTPENTITSGTSRSCRTCVNTRAREKYQQEKREAAPVA